MISIELAVSGALIQFIWQGALVALLFSIVLTALRRRPPQLRYLAGSASLFILAVLPIFTTWFLYGSAPSVYIGPISQRLTADWTLPLWMTGMLLFSLRPIWNLRQLSVLLRGGAQPEWWIVDLAQRVANRMGCSRAFDLLVLAIAETPAVAGWMQPVILLPAATIAGLTVEQLETILAHEIAHIRRRDYLVNVLQVAVETLLFYHPAVWWISSRIRLERELCCDDEVVRVTGDALRYSRALTVLERLRVAPPAMAVGSAGGRLSYRIRRLIGNAPSSPEMRPAALALVMALALVLAWATVGVRWVRAQQEADMVTVEVIRDKHLAISGLRIISGPDYLRPLALRAAVSQAMGIQNISGNIGASVPLLPRELVSAPSRAETITFPAAFERSSGQQQVIAKYLGATLAQAEQAVQTITGDTPEDRRKLKAAKEKLASLQMKQSIVRANQLALELPERQWKAEVLRHQVTEFRKQYKGKLSPGTNPGLETRYGQMIQALAAAEREFAEVGAR
jgi:beta-lactamase regulating signal transducer with metallopeptidase domain